MSDNDARLALMKLCRGIFGTSNLIGTDFDDVRVFEVAGRNLPQQIDGNGHHSIALRESAASQRLFMGMVAPSGLSADASIARRNWQPMGRHATVAAGGAVPASRRCCPRPGLARTRGGRGESRGN